MRSCSLGLSSLDFAETGFDDKVGISYFDMQYFPTLQRVDTGAPVELQILLERRGDRIVARSPLFTTDALGDAEFLKPHHVDRWNVGGRNA